MIYLILFLLTAFLVGGYAIYLVHKDNEESKD